MRPGTLLAAFLLVSACALPAQDRAGSATDDVAPLVIGETFTITSRALGERRRINVYLPPGYVEMAATRFPVLYMPDGGLGEDFLHIAVPVGGSAAFRSFLRAELMPRIRERYRTTEEAAIVGESLAGLFVVESFFTEPDLFDTYVAFDPNLWWNDEALVRSAGERLGALPVAGKTLYHGSSGDAGLADLVRALTADLARAEGLRWFHAPMPDETHATIYHPVALRAFRTVFKPAATP